MRLKNVDTSSVYDYNYIWVIMAFLDYGGNDELPNIGRNCKHLEHLAKKSSDILQRGKDKGGSASRK